MVGVELLGVVVGTADGPALVGELLGAVDGRADGGEPVGASVGVELLGTEVGAADEPSWSENCWVSLMEEQLVGIRSGPQSGSPSARLSGSQSCSRSARWWG